MATDKLPLTFRPMLLETVVVMRGNKVAGTIKRYRAHKAVIVSVPGLMAANTHNQPFKGQRTFKTVAEAKAKLLELDKA